MEVNRSTLSSLYNWKLTDNLGDERHAPWSELLNLELIDPKEMNLALDNENNLIVQPDFDVLFGPSTTKSII